MSITYQPYTYLVGWSKHNMWYYGARYAKGCNPDDLWVTYIRSSREVAKKLLEIGEPDIIQIRKRFKTALLTRLWEANVLLKMNVTEKKEWLNNYAGLTPDRTGSIHTHSSLQRMSISQKEKWLDESYRNDVVSSISHSTQTPEFRNLKSKQTSQLWQDNDYKTTQTNKMAQSVHSKEKWKDASYRERYNKTMASREILTCPHCGIESKSKSNMKRYHFDNCKSKE